MSGRDGKKSTARSGGSLSQPPGRWQRCVADGVVPGRHLDPPGSSQESVEQTRLLGCSDVQGE